jgi:uncharacterized protein
VPGPAAEPIAPRWTGAGSRVFPVGLGLRWEHLELVACGPDLPVDFFEVSPENYMRRGGQFPKLLERVRSRYPLSLHGLTMSVGSGAPMEAEYVNALREFIQRLDAPFHSDHLCFSNHGSVQFHELLPLAFTAGNARRVAEQVSRIQDVLRVPLALENITYYANVGPTEMSEAEFIAAVLQISGANLLLDVNNVFVNAINHGYDPRAFIDALPLERVREVHVAGHSRRFSPATLPRNHRNADCGREWLIDTHGAPLAPEVVALLEYTLCRVPCVPVLLERDQQIPPLVDLIAEVTELRRACERVQRLRSNHEPVH